MEILLIAIALLAAILLILVVIIQPGKSDMISGMGGLGGQMTNLLGVRQAGNILQNITMILLGIIALIAISVNKFFLTADEGAGRAPVTQGVAIPQGPVPTQAPPQPTTPAQP